MSGNFIFNSLKPSIFPNTVNGVVDALYSIFEEGYYADKVIERILKTNTKWGSRDRAFVAENVYDMVRWWRLLWTLSGKEPSTLKRDLWDLFGIWWMYKGNELPNWEFFNNIRGFDIEAAKKALPNDLKVVESYPDWIDSLAESELGERWKTIAHNSNIQAKMIVRTNTLKIKRPQLIEALEKEGVQVSPLPFNEVGIVLEKRVNLFRLNAFKNGWFEVQDGGSQMIAEMLRVEPGQRVVDACAGAGGKSLHLASVLNNKGSVLAMDVEGWKLNELKKRAKRNGAHNIETRLIENSKTIKRLKGKADRLLLDVPCSGLGVIKRNPDTKWKLSSESLEETRELQARLIREYSEMLKPGGLMIYATCSILPSENENQVAQFVAEKDGTFELIEEKTQSPSEFTDGFYMALLKKNG